MVRRFAYSAPFFQVPSPGQGWDFFAGRGAAKRKSGRRRLASGSRFQSVEKPPGVRGPQPPEVIIGFGGVYGKSAKSHA